MRTSFSLNASSFRALQRGFLSAVVIAAAILCFAPTARGASSSSSIGYVFDSNLGTGANDPNFLGSSIFVDALTGSDPGPTYTTADGTKTVSLTDVPVSSIDGSGAVALAPYDTVVLFQACDIGAHPATVGALNTFVENGGKLLIYDADRCADSDGGAGVADYGSFVFPFSTSSPGPGGRSSSYATIVASTLTTGLSVGVQAGDSVGDANVFTSPTGPWCTSIVATNGLGANGIVEATARTPSGGLVIYEGEDFWNTTADAADRAHLRQVFDNELEQNWAPDGLPCPIPASGISLAPASQTGVTGGSASLTATVVDITGRPVPGTSVHFAVSGGPDAGQSGDAVTDPAGQATFTYRNSGAGGSDTIGASFVDSVQATHESLATTVAWDPRISATGTALTATAGRSFTGQVATFTDPDLSAKPNEYSAAIDWGDGSPTSTGTITGGGGTFTVEGTHTYSHAGSETITVTITDTDTPSNAASATTQASVGPPPTLPSAPPGVSVACSPGVVAAGTSTTCTATVSGPSGAPAGSVSFTSTGGSAVSGGGTCTLRTSFGSGTCSVSFTLARAASGTFTFTASYGGDAAYAPASGFTNVATPAPAGVAAAVSVVQGTVLILVKRHRAPHRAADDTAGQFVPLKGTESVPVGSTIDARKGVLTVSTAADYSPTGSPGYRSQSATFAAAIFEIQQLTAEQARNRAKRHGRRRPAPPSTDLSLVTPPGQAAQAGCRRHGRPGTGVVNKFSATHGNGFYRTIGRSSITTIKGKATWAVLDRCNGTVTEMGVGTATVTPTGHARRHQRARVVHSGEALLIKGRFL